MGIVLSLSFLATVTGFVLIVVGKYFDEDDLKIWGTGVLLCAIFFGFFLAGLTIPVKTITTTEKIDRIISNEVGVAYLFQHDRGKVECIWSTDIKILQNPKRCKVITTTSTNSYGGDIEHDHVLVEQQKY